MDAYDPSTAECLRRLLEEQHSRLRCVSEKIGGLHKAAAHDTQPTHWSGLARISHDAAAQQMLSQLTLARDALDRATDHSARAVATMATRVG